MELNKTLSKWGRIILFFSAAVIILSLITIAWAPAPEALGFSQNFIASDDESSGDDDDDDDDDADDDDNGSVDDDESSGDDDGSSAADDDDPKADDDDDDWKKTNTNTLYKDSSLQVIQDTVNGNLFFYHAGFGWKIKFASLKRSDWLEADVNEVLIDLPYEELGIQLKVTKMSDGQLKVEVFNLTGGSLKTMFLIGK